MRWSPIDVHPLSVTLSRLLGAMTRDYAATGPVPSLALWSALLRFSGAGPITPADVSGLACISKRAATAATQNAQRRGWVRLEPDPAMARRKTITFTPQGLAAAVAGKLALDGAETRWERDHADVLPALRADLEAIVGRFDLDLPHYPIAYGLGDVSFTGGDHVPGEPGPPRLPPHGKEWRPVVRRDPGSTADLSFTALLAQALVQYTIDYDSAGRGTLHAAVQVLRHYPGRPLHVTGDGRSGLERHGIVVATDEVAAGGLRVAALTPLGRQHRESFAPLVREVDDDWQRRHGAAVVGRVRDGLTTLANRLGDGLPDHLVVGLASWG